VRTFVATDEGELEFQHYFVRRHCVPRVSSLSYRNADTARPAPIGGRPWTEMEIAGVIICPSNPYLSIAPMLAMPAAHAWLKDRRFPVAAVSPIVAGKALKGPAAKIMAELGTEPSALTPPSMSDCGLLRHRQKRRGACERIRAEGMDGRHGQCDDERR
jgi:LPPG:FO 2-phospho-L-lactate transferase